MGLHRESWFCLPPRLWRLIKWYGTGKGGRGPERVVWELLVTPTVVVATLLMLMAAAVTVGVAVMVVVVVEDNINVCWDDSGERLVWLVTISNGCGRHPSGVK